MANYSAPSFTLTWDSNNLTPFIETVSDIEIDGAVDEITSIGGANPNIASVGFTEMKDITLGGPWNDAATAADGGTIANFGTYGQISTLAFGYGNDKSTSSDFIVKTLKRTIVKKKVTRFQVVLQQTGAITEA